MRTLLIDDLKIAQDRRRNFNLLFIWMFVMVSFLLVGPLVLTK